MAASELHINHIHNPQGPYMSIGGGGGGGKNLS